LGLIQKYLDELTYELIGAAIELHKRMGRGLLDSVYHACLKEELLHKENFLSELKIPVEYRNKKLAIDFRCDFFVENTIVIVLKSIYDLSTIHEAQLLNYMKLLKVPKGILINFNCNNIFHQGQKTLVNRYFNDLPKQ